MKSNIYSNNLLKLNKLFEYFSEKKLRGGIQYLVILLEKWYKYKGIAIYKYVIMEN